MAVRVGINGFGRIGRSFTRALLARGADAGVELAAVNDPMGDSHTVAFLLKHDSVGGTLANDVQGTDNGFSIDGREITKLEVMDPAEIPWSDHGVDVVIESTGIFTAREKAAGHLGGSVGRVIISAPSGDADATICMGVNDEVYDASTQTVISNASCTTNCLAPMAKVLNDAFGIKRGLMTTVHATTATQKTVDGPSNKDWRGGRGILENIIPSSTGAAKAVGVVIPELNKTLTRMSFRVPTSDVSVIDLTVELLKEASYKDICAEMKAQSQGALKGVLGYTEDKVVSTDFRGEAMTSVFDAEAGIALDGTFVKVVAWYDNEWGYSNKTLEMARVVAKANA